MRIKRWGTGKSIQGNPGEMVYVTREEAIRLAESLLRQIRTREPNDGRAEFTTDDDEYFSVCVDEAAAHDGHIRAERAGLGPVRPL